MTDEERFLKAEEAATRLAESLTRLKEEMGSYREAAGRLDGAVAAVSGLSDQVVNVAQSAQQGLDAIRSAGGPELLTRIDAARQDIGHVQSDMNRQLEPLPSMGGGIAVLDQAVHTVSEEVLGVGKSVRTVLWLAIVALVISVATLVMAIVARLP
jgi:hypothetical protein